jgi:hypothetical protein
MMLSRIDTSVQEFLHWNSYFGITKNDEFKESASNAGIPALVGIS